ncbi:hypothetical protein M0G43_04820 [Subsaxibacter sp. CAU 1640]|uniref:hypothetical protein n=1 Tax=Subsaxibacter sp. CAU 1640 TaxID=2933271 RepID=UPI002004EF30|nr:hypothetical protein [Subsaxibacter sp. CAU 1640]MCK7589888.1 hypothetical protein [Subsaxibacter sp. CAU 1640]
MKTLMDSTSASVIFFNNQRIKHQIDGNHGLQVKFRFSSKILLIVGFEDLILKDYHDSCKYILNTKHFKDTEYLKLLIIRDVKNVMASRLNHAHMANQLRKHKKVVEFTRNIWFDHHSISESIDINIVRYNHLMADLRKMNLKPFFISDLQESNKILNRYGGGSSFENSRFNNRYENFQNDETFEALIKDFIKIDNEVYAAR